MNDTQVNIHGSNNSLELGDLSRLSHCRIHITGNNNRISIGARVLLRGITLVIEDDGNAIVVGDGTRIYEDGLLAAIEGTTITIGTDCMVASGCQVRTGDSHSVTDLQGVRLNPAADVSIGGHVWIGTRVICLAGSSVASNSIVGAGAVVNRPHSQQNVIIAGVPARVVKHGVDWLGERI